MIQVRWSQNVKKSYDWSKDKTFQHTFSLFWSPKVSTEIKQRSKYISLNFLKFIYSEKATKLCEIFTLLLAVCTVVRSKVKMLQNFVAFSEYMNFTIRYTFGPKPKVDFLKLKQSCLKKQIATKIKVIRRKVCWNIN